MLFESNDINNTQKQQQDTSFYGTNQTPIQIDLSSNNNDSNRSNESSNREIFNSSYESYQIERDLDKEHENNCFSCCHKGDKKTSRAFSFAKLLKSSKYTRVSFYKNHISFFVIIALYALVNVGLGILQFMLYESSNIAIRIARVGGILLDFNCSLIILLVLRRLITWMRNSVIGRNFLPLDDFIKFHKFIGVYILLLSIVHTLAHCVNLFWLSSEFLDGRIRRPHRNSSHILSAILNSTNDDEFMSNNTDSIPMSSSSGEINLRNKSLTHRFNSSWFDKTNRPHAPSYAELLFTTKSGIGWVGQAAMPTGWVLLVVLGIMLTFSLPFIRKKGHFQLFYLTHWLHIVFYIFLILHATNYWKWFIFPMALVIFERIYTCFRVQSVKYGDTYIKDVKLLSSKVTQLIITRPPNFKFRSGDYLYIKIPTIARYEWHPFTISSAPELKEELWLHIRSLGNWTNKLYEYFYDISKNSNKQNSLFNGSGLRHFEAETKYERKMSKLVVMTDYKKNDTMKAERANKKTNKVDDQSGQDTKIIEMNLNISNNIKNIWMDITIDGPYSTASRRIMDSEHAILIAGGIGVTPFASILQSLWFKYTKTLKTCSKCQHQWYDILEQKKIKKVDFIWVNRDYQSFEWFIELLGELEMQQLNLTSNESERFIDIHLYMTSASVVQEIKPLEYHMADKLEQMQNRNKNFSLKLNPGRPNFDDLFTSITAGKKVDVFFCGNREFGHFVQKKCYKNKFKFYKEYF